MYQEIPQQIAQQSPRYGIFLLRYSTKALPDSLKTLFIAAIVKRVIREITRNN